MLTFLPTTNNIRHPTSGRARQIISVCVFFWGLGSVLADQQRWFPPDIHRPRDTCDRIVGLKPCIIQRLPVIVKPWLSQRGTCVGLCLIVFVCEMLIFSMFSFFVDRLLNPRTNRCCVCAFDAKTSLMF